MTVDEALVSSDAHEECGAWCYWGHVEAGVLANEVRRLREKLAGAKQEIESVRQETWAKCPGPEAFMVVAHPDDLALFHNPIVDACHPHRVMVRAGYESSLSQARAENARLREALNNMQEFHDCMEAQRKDRGLSLSQKGAFCP